MTDIEEVLLQASEKDKGAINKLIGMLDAYQTKALPAAIQKMIAENLGLIFDDVENNAQDEAMELLALKLADAGFESMLLRDTLAAVSRRVYSSYPDPAGLIRIFGIFDQSTSIKDIRRRWQAFALLVEKSVIWNGSYGLGTVTEIDPFSDLIYIKFKRTQHFSLLQAVSTMAVAHPDSTVAKIFMKKEKAFNPRMTVKDIRTLVREEFVPAPQDHARLIEALLVPNWMHERNFKEWLGAATKKKKAVESTKAKHRSWHEARSLEELKIALQGVKTIDDSLTTGLQRIYYRDAMKPLATSNLVKTLATLWTICGDRPWLVELIKGLPEDMPAWASEEDYLKSVTSLPATMLPAWFQISYVARGGEWLLEMVTGLPLRYFAVVEKILPTTDRTVDDLFTLVLRKLKKGKASADATVWLWRQQREDAEATFANPNVIFRVLARTVRGDFLKAYRELYKLLIDDQDFQRALMNGGTDKGIHTLVKLVKNSTVLQRGEQQSLLVKIVRIFPDAQSIVEDRKKVVARRAIPKSTSIRSFEARRQELTKIINEKIPKNSAAIAHARSYGDLRENAEFKAAKDEQRLLMARRGELERGLKEIMATDFSDVQVFDTVIPGCTVELELETGDREIYYVLGLWDSNPEMRILSYETPLGKSLIGKHENDAFQMPQNVAATIKAIQPLPEAIKDWVSATSD